jgi:hypothetical protein
MLVAPLSRIVENMLLQSFYWANTASGFGQARRDRYLGWQITEMAESAAAPFEAATGRSGLSAPEGGAQQATQEAPGL